MTTMPAGAASGSARKQLVRISWLDGWATTKEGGATASEVTDVYDGGQVKPDKEAGPPVTDNVTVTKVYRPALHAGLRRTLPAQVGNLRGTVSVFDADADLGPIGEPVEVYADALLVRFEPPPMDASSADTSMMTFEFAVK